VRADQIAVLLRKPESYLLTLEEAFRRSGIPMYGARGARKPSPAGRAFVALLRTRLENHSASRFSEYLSFDLIPDALALGDAAEGPLAAPGEPRALPFVPADDTFADMLEDEPEADAQPAEEASLAAARVTPRYLEQLLVDAAVIGGVDRWERRIEGLLARCTLALETATESQKPVLLRERKALTNLRAFVLPLFAAMQDWDAPRTWAAWLTTLRALAILGLREPTRVLAVLSEFEPLGEMGPLSLADVVLALEPRLLLTHALPKADRYGAVFVGSVPDARGLSFEVVFVPGCTEKQFPDAPREDPLLLDKARTKLCPELQTQIERSLDERKLFACAVQAARSALRLSFSRLDVEGGRPKTPSIYLLEAVLANEGALPTMRDLLDRSLGESDVRLGFPAPEDPKDAIDSAEYDLAVLGKLLFANELEAQGLARYLLTQNVYLAQSLRARAQRWGTKKWQAADGLLLEGQAAVRSLSDHQVSARSFSPTALQHFAACPYRFFLQAVLRLSPREVPEAIEELGALDRGSLVHETLFGLMVTLQQKQMLPMNPEDMAPVFRELDIVLSKVEKEFRDRLAPAIDKVWEDGLRRIAADLREALRRMAADTAFEPVYFELSFGIATGDNRDERSSDEPVLLSEGMKLRGSVDLVERRRSDGALRATDYKTGKVKAEKGSVVSGGEILQPVFYGLALEKILPGSTVLGGRLSYCTEAGAYQVRDVALSDDARASAKALVDGVDASLKKGFFPAAPKKDACKYCDYQRVCGPYEEVRVSRKPTLPVLDRIRGLV
jgi:ATP-dependent helicase/nuclease subunit B